MERMSPQDMMEHAILSMKEDGMYCDDLRTIAFCYYILTGEQSEIMLSEFDLTQEDVDVHFANNQKEDPIELEENRQYQEAIEIEQRQSNIITDTSQSSFSQANNRKTEIRLPRNNYTHSTPLVPPEGRRKNRFFDDGTYHREDKVNFDSKVARPTYEFNRRPPASIMIDKRCRDCRREFSVDEAEFNEFSKEDGLYEFGYICPSCSKSSITGVR